MRAIVLYSKRSVPLSVEVIAVDGDKEAIMAYGNRLCERYEADGMSDMDFVLLTVDTPAIHCYNGPAATRTAEEA